MSFVLPARFVDSLASLPGIDPEAFLSVHQSVEQVTSIRLNPAKPTHSIDDLPLGQEVPWCNNGRYLLERPSFTLDPVFHGGAYYVQEASSMFIDFIIKQVYRDKPPPRRVLDLCAAPGGKSTLLAAALPDSFIVSNEVIKTRVPVLAENISKWGSDNVVVTNNDPRDFKRLGGCFDLVLIDAPCSGSGLFRKDRSAVEEWSGANVAMCSTRQKRIVSDAIGSLKQDGVFIYSTCSYSAEEDEDIADWITETFDLEPVKIPVDPSWGVVETESKMRKAPGYRFYPDKLQGEGFFVACFRQVNVVDEWFGQANKVQVASKQIQAIVAPFLKEPANYVVSDYKEIVIASLKRWAEEIGIVSNILQVKKSGVAVGTVKGKDLIPHHELVLSDLLAAGIPVINLEKDDALKYLRRQDLAVADCLPGWTIVRYGDISLGWVKVLPNRVNNYYPTNWRILKS